MTTAMADALARVERELALEQATSGLDALNETALHPILAEGLGSFGLGVHREVPFPSDEADSDDAHAERDRERCDLVVTETADIALLDPRADRRERKAIEGSIFAPVADRIRTTGAEPEDAMWIEVKSAHQFAFVRGAAEANPAYSRQIIDALAMDFAKLRAEPRIEHGGVALVLFTQSGEVAAHDAVAGAHALLDLGLPARAPVVETRAITDRMGNGAVSVCLFGTRRG